MTTENTTTVEEKNLVPENENSTMAVITYITVIGLIIAFISNQEKKDAYVQFHIKQSLGIVLTGFALGVIGIIPILGWLISFLGFFFVVFLWIMGLMNAINKKEKVVPLLGEKYAEWFKNI